VVVFFVGLKGVLALGMATIVVAMGYHVHFLEFAL